MFDKLKKLLGGGEPPETTKAGRPRPGGGGPGAARRPAQPRPRSAQSGKFSPLDSRGLSGGQAAGPTAGKPGGMTGGKVGQTGGPPGGQTGPARDRSVGPRAAMGPAGTGRGAGAPGGFGPASGLPAAGGPGAAGGLGGASGLGYSQRSDLSSQGEVPCPNCGEPMLPGWGTTCGKCRPNLVAAKTMFLSDEQVALPAHAAGAMTLGWLVVIRSPDDDKRSDLLELDRERIVLSRAGAAPTGSVRVVQFDDSYMSSAHAVIGRPATGDRSDAFTIRDRDNPAPSVNGTFVNSQQLRPGELVRLADGDVIKVGATELLFKSLWLPPVGMRAS